MSEPIYHIKVTASELDALSAAIADGALAQRQATLRALLQHNRDHCSIGNSIEREIAALTRAGAAVFYARER